MSDVCVHGAQGGTDAAVAEGSQPARKAVYTLDRTPRATMMTIAFGPAIDLVSMVVGELQDVVATIVGVRYQGRAFRSSSTARTEGHEQRTTIKGMAK